MNDNSPGGFPGADAFTRMWSDFATQMMRSGMASTPQATPPEAARDMRSTMLKAWTEYCDQYMRSTEFLDMMKQSLTTSIQARKQLNDFLGQAQHELQGASRQDVDQIMLTMQHMERRVVDGMERLEAKLDELGTRLDKVENKTSRSTRKTSKSGPSKPDSDEET